ncbi:histidine kinase [Burkholderiaceae bacterium FT117]|uniref:ATP-binding protein n=1 Tax=Zeimonas sediminis TaxID=2944268 RepID=UPI0023430C1A|nr:ATP-binding protein [Zeimonas sediminis]MCM5572351.1 histidine kinase [Zeimonas sediminis]
MRTIAGIGENSRMRIMANLRSLLEQSLLLRLGMLLGAIATLAVFVIGAATVYLDSVAGRSGAIDLSGSLRMLTYRMALAVDDATPEGRGRYRQAVGDLERRLADPALRSALQSDSSRELHARLVARWRDVLGPASDRQRTAVDHGLAAGHDAAYLIQVDEFVGLADRLTAELGANLEQRLANLRLIQGLALFMVFALVLATMYLIHTQALIPILDLVEASRALKARRLDTRVSHDGPDEMGQLGQAFNAMAEELQAGYALLEQRVNDKTADLARSHRQLEVLYSVTRTLTESKPTQGALGEVLETLCAALGACCAQLRAADPGRDAQFVVATVDRGGCEVLLAGLAEGPGSGAPDAGTPDRGIEVVGTQLGTIVRAPLREGGEALGALALALSPARPLEAWERSLLESVARHLGAALANARRARDEQLLGLFEERAVIARELHDSLAQSLSFLKIQVSRISAELRAGRDPSQIVGELRVGLNSAYRQLRELLSTFRLSLGDGGFAAALEATIREFSERGELAIDLSNSLPDTALSAAEQIHVLQIVRESLANALHHARAATVLVRLAMDPERNVQVSIEDDGVGIPIERGEDVRRHHGLTIMRDRARTLGGTIAFGPGARGGTRVELRFRAATPFAPA